MVAESFACEKSDTEPTTGGEFTQKQVAESGAVGIVREALRFFSRYGRELFLIQLIVGLPLVVISVAFEFFSYSENPRLQIIIPLVLGSSLEGANLQSFMVTFSTAGISPGHFLITNKIESSIIQAAEAITIAANIYAVRLIYTDNRLSVEEVLKRAFYFLWRRLLVTLLCTQLLFIGCLLVFFGCISLLFQFQLSPLWGFIPTVLRMVSNIYLSTIYTVASGLCILEDDYGWAALQKARKLLEGKFCVALRFQVLFVMVVGISALGRGMLTQFREDLWNPMFYFCAIPYVVGITFASQINALSTGVACVSFKAWHGETTESLLIEPDNSCLEDIFIE